MAKVKKKTEGVRETVYDYGLCKDCQETVKFVVDPFQLAGSNRFVCPDCRAKRIRKLEKEKAEGKVATLMEKVAEAEENARQQLLPLEADE